MSTCHVPGREGSKHQMADTGQGSGSADALALAFLKRYTTSLDKEPHVSIHSRLAAIALVTALLVPANALGAGAGAAAVEQSAAPVATATDTAKPTVSGLLANGREDPIGISGEDPRLSWQLNAARRGVVQTAYEIHVSTAADRLDSPNIWDSGKVESDQSVGVVYGGSELRSHTTYYWSVRVWDGNGTVSAWSEPATFETGLLSASEWTGDWIGAAPEQIGQAWQNYTIEFTASNIDKALGVFFRGRDEQHAYMWQISAVDKSLRPHVRNGGYTVLAATPFPDGFDFAATHDYRIAVDGRTISFFVDGALLDRRTNSVHTAAGVIGFRTNGEESGLVHDITVTSADGTVLVDTTFRTDSARFTAGTVSDGKLLVSGTTEAWYAAFFDEVPILRTDFTVSDKPIESARIYASAQGIYEMRLNGERVGSQELAPGWTDYRKRIQYQTYDVTELLEPGSNAVGAQLADGWYSGRIAMFGDEIYGSKNAFIAELRIEYGDGSTHTVATDETWRTTPGPIKSADILDGERYDARRAQELGAWSESPYDDSGWEPVQVRPSVTERLEPQTDQPVRATQELSAQRLPSPSPGVYIYDLGQNMVGHVRVTLSGERGETVRIRHGEVLNPDGSLYTANLRSAKATDYYTFAGTGQETYEPSFTYHGFRYVEITGVDSPPPASAITGVVVGSDGDLVSEFSTSSEMVNQLHSNIVWGMRGNFLSIPTDTPARDERMGWTGDINVFAETAVYNMDSQAFLKKWLQDLRDTQRADGALPGVAPVVPGRFNGGYGPAGWADAGVHVPWTLWQAYGDTEVIRQNYTMMKRYVDYLAADSTDYIRSAGGYLDWLNLNDPTPADVLDTAFMAKSTREFAWMAAAIGRTQDAEAYMTRYEKIRDAFQKAFIAEDGTVKGDSQTAYILTIMNDLAPADRRDAVTKQFVQTLERRDYHLSTGFLGVSGLLPALTKVGRSDLAYRLLLNEDYPSWGYEIKKGATTVWERWNSIRLDGSFGPVSMNSFNHYAYGAVGEWMYRTLAGVSALEPGYKKILLAPQPGEDISSATFEYETRYGTVRSAWKKAADGLSLDVTVPGNTTAKLRIPAPNRWAVTEGGIPAAEAKAVRFVKMDAGDAVFELGSGSYSFDIDTVLGTLGAALHDTESLRSLVAELAGAGKLATPVERHLDAQTKKLHREVDAAWQSYLDGDRASAASKVHRALSTSQSLRRWVTTQTESGRIEPATADRIQEQLRLLREHLSTASGSLVKAVSRLVPADGEHFPGDQARVSVVVHNNGQHVLTGLDSTLRAPDGWKVTPTGDQPGTVQPGQSVSHSYTVEIPLDEQAGDKKLAGTVRYRYQSGTATLPVTAALPVAAPVEIVSVATAPESMHPGGDATVRTVLRNRTDDVRSGRLNVAVPDGWAAPKTVEYELAPQESRPVNAGLRVPLTVTEGPAKLSVSIGSSAAEHATTSLSVGFENPPAVVHDHIDLGNAESEQAHALEASAASGTNVEAGLTRRYTNRAVPGGWFEFTLHVPEGEPFILRSIETYDGAQLKTYDVIVDGVRVHQRAYHRTDGEVGSLTYQFVVDDPQVTADGVVRVRFQDVEGGYDPSIADVWATPVTE